MIDMLTLLLICILVGLLGSLTGLGGASILIPILVFLGVPVKEAVACGMVAIIATSSGSAASFVRNRITNLRLAMYLEMFTIHQLQKLPKRRIHLPKSRQTIQMARFARELL
jgi:uncharacterized membrane protein YfcA